jgi:hypothetical protein
MNECAYHCFEIGGGYIAENPDCPVHGRDKPIVDTRELVTELIKCWEEIASDRKSAWENFEGLSRKTNEDMQEYWQRAERRKEDLQGLLEDLDNG